MSASKLEPAVMQAYTQILHNELKEALGCTEPIAIAYAAAYATKLLGRLAEHFRVSCSGNIIKNVKAVTVPQTGGMTGIEAAVLIGAIGGDADLGMQVLTCVTDADRETLRACMEKHMVEVSLLESAHVLHIVIEATSGSDCVSVEIIDSHTQLGTVIKNGVVLHELEAVAVEDNRRLYETLNIESILTYADTVDLETVRDVLQRQVDCNLAIAREGLEHGWGESVGKTLIARDNTLYTKLAATAAAGSDARMNGCALPVVINSGSGNQGMTIGIPVALYAQEKGLSKEKMYRALCVANLIAAHQKTSIGKLSAFCGAVSAAAGAACGIAYLDGATIDVISQTLINCIATIGGMVCDGAKSSCAGKIAAALNTAFLGYEMAKAQHVFRSGEGIVKDDVEQTITSVGRMAAKGMRSTDTEILNIMIGK